jgi:hypothetical protein
MASFSIRFTEFRLFEKNELRFVGDEHALKSMFTAHGSYLYSLKPCCVFNVANLIINIHIV